MRTDEPRSADDFAAAESQLLHAIGLGWSKGWQPRELVRAIRIAVNRDALGIALAAIAVDNGLRRDETLDPRWVAQLDQLSLPNVAVGPGWLPRWARDNPQSKVDPVLVAGNLASRVGSLRAIEMLIPPPGTTHGDRAMNLTAKTDDPMLNRVRALLAQAESTNFEAEAETFTAKAQELMTRHAIDMAMVAAGTTQSDRPGTIRILIDAPYVHAKWTLLNEVAASSRCSAVFMKRLEIASIVGYDADLQATETLFTSLLVQAQVALRAATASAAPGDPERTRTFKSSFLLAYAYRVGERLKEINARVAAATEAETGRDIFPVLAHRSAQVEARVEELFPRLGTMRSRATVDPEGWASGRIAADRAKLNHGDLRAGNRALRAG
jgi:hypothetical protein